MGMKGMLLVVLRLRAAGHLPAQRGDKYEMPVLGYDAPLCPVAIGQPGDCAPSGARARAGRRGAGGCADRQAAVPS